MNNLEELIYTYKHRKIVMFLAKMYFDNNELIEQLKKHDIDKMYLLLFYEKKKINAFHRSISSHHDNDIPKTELDYIEMVLDWESARYTKDDKPLNAYDTMKQFYPHLENNIMPILERMNIAYSTTEKNEKVAEYAKSLGNPTINDIKEELVNYIENTPSKNNIKVKVKKDGNNKRL